MILYYSATGNSRHCAARLADLCGDEAVDVFAYIKNGVAGEFVSGRPFVFVSPTHGWRLPGIFADFIRAARFSGNERAYFVMSCGSDAGNAAEYNRALCAEKGLEYMGTLAVIMPENYLALFRVPSEPEARGIVRRAEAPLAAAAARITAALPFEESAPAPLDRLKSGAVNAAFLRFIVSSRRFRALDACVGCGKCAAVCPVNGIAMENGRPRWTGECCHCMACICSCPAGAIEYGRASEGKPRYRCPEV